MNKIYRELNCPTAQHRVILWVSLLQEEERLFLFNLNYSSSIKRGALGPAVQRKFGGRVEGGGGSARARTPGRRQRRWRPPAAGPIPGERGASGPARQDRNPAGRARGGGRGGGSGSLSPEEVGRGVGGCDAGAEPGRPTPTCGPGQPPRARPSASPPPPPPALVAPRLLLRGRGRRRPEPRRARARARLPAAAPRRLARRPGEPRAALRSPTPLARERRPRRLPHVSPGCPVSQQFPPGPQRRLRRCCHRLSHIPGLQGSRRRAATTTLRAAAPGSRLPRSPPTRSARLGRGRARPRPPQPPAHNPPRGAAGAGGPRPGRGERSPPPERRRHRRGPGPPGREVPARRPCPSSRGPARGGRNHAGRSVPRRCSGGSQGPPPPRVLRSPGTRRAGHSPTSHLSPPQPERCFPKK